MATSGIDATDAALYSEGGPFRIRNEDCALAASGDGVFVVADGVGGAAGGDRASRIAVDSVVRVLQGDASLGEETGESLGGELKGFLANALVELGNGPRAQLRQAFLLAHWRVVDEGQRSGMVRMATAMVATHVVNGTAWIAHVGDCRAYVLQDAGIRVLTEDHSLAARLARAGGLPAGAERSPYLRNRLTQVVGGRSVADAEVCRWTPTPGSVLLLCTDGVWGAVARSEISEVLASGSPASAISRELVESSYAAGGRDNSTALVVRFGGE